MMLYIVKMSCVWCCTHKYDVVSGLGYDVEAQDYGTVTSMEHYVHMSMMLWCNDVVLTTMIVRMSMAFYSYQWICYTTHMNYQCCNETDQVVSGRW